MSPTLMHRGYIAAPGEVDFSAQRVPSLSVGAQLCGALAGAEAFRLLLGRAAPPERVVVQHFDPYLRRLRVTARRKGNRSLVSRLMIRYAIHKTSGWQRTAPAVAASASRTEAP